MSWWQRMLCKRNRNSLCDIHRYRNWRQAASVIHMHAHTHRASGPVVAVAMATDWWRTWEAHKLLLGCLFCRSRPRRRWSVRHPGDCGAAGGCRGRSTQQWLSGKHLSFRHCSLQKFYNQRKSQYKMTGSHSNGALSRGSVKPLRQPTIIIYTQVPGCKKSCNRFDRNNAFSSCQRHFQHHVIGCLFSFY